MKKIFTLLSILTISIAVLAQESVGNGVYEWKDNEISIRSTSDIDSITFTDYFSNTAPIEQKKVQFPGLTYSKWGG